MTDAEWMAMPLGEFFAMADKVGAAAKVLQDARALLGGGHGAQRDAATPLGVGHETAPPKVAWSPEEQAQREELAALRAAKVAQSNSAIEAAVLAGMPR